MCEAEERRDVTIVEFLPTGAVRSQSHQNPDGSEWSLAHEYDHAGRPIAIKSQDSSDSGSLRLHEYDATGRLTRVLVRTADGGERIDESYEYDGAGRKVKTQYASFAGSAAGARCFWGVEVTDTSYSAPAVAIVNTVHDEDDHPTELVFRDAANHVISRVEFTYDSAGNVTEESQTSDVEATFADMLSQMNPQQLEAMRALLASTSRRAHRYDGDGRRIETISNLFGPMGTDRKTMAYNEHGDLIEQVTEDEHSGFSVADDGRLTETEHKVSRSEARFRYVYDDRGNWLEKVVESRHEDGAFTVSSIERRTITYYE